MSLPRGQLAWITAGAIVLAALAWGGADLSDGNTAQAPAEIGPGNDSGEPVPGATEGSAEGDSPDTPHTEPAPGMQGSQAGGEGGVGTALQQLQSLPVKGRAPSTGYDREGQFGPAWLDIDANGCDTRNDILLRDLDDTIVDQRCRVLSGTLRDPFSADVITFERGETTSVLVQIDHVVALSNAWQTGAQQLDESTRVQFANDPLNLIAVSGRLNAQKGNADAATWLPPDRGFWCEYVARQVGVKHYYSLWVTPAEYDRIEQILTDCGNYPALDPATHGAYRPGSIPMD